MKARPYPPPSPPRYRRRARGRITACRAAQTPAPAAATGPADGAALFAANCAACHQPEGQGIPGAFPALAGDPFVVGDPKPVVLTLLNGRGGMPTFRDDLKDDQLAAIISYVRASWGNKAPADRRGDVRRAARGRQDERSTARSRRIERRRKHMKPSPCLFQGPLLPAGRGSVDAETSSA